MNEEFKYTIDKRYNFHISPALFSSDIADSVKSDYLALISVNEDDKTTEDIICKFYREVIGLRNIDESDFWLALAYCEWKNGRLSQRVKTQALTFIKDEASIAPWKSEKTTMELETVSKSITDRVMQVKYE